MAHYETGYAETEALRKLITGDAAAAERILDDLTIQERLDLAAEARCLVDLAEKPYREAVEG